MKFKALYLECTDPQAQAAFYHEKLGFAGKTNSFGGVELHLHDARLVFGEGSGQPPYHFAMHIPAGSEEKALEWLEGKVNVLERHGNRIQDFQSWNARSLYFQDPEGNVVEFISRPGFADNTQAFGPGALAGLAEIGLATGSIREVYTALEEKLGLDIYDGDFEAFCAVGDDEALFICVKQEEKTWFPTEEPALPADFAVQTAAGKVVAYKDRDLHLFLSLDAALDRAQRERGTAFSTWLAQAIGNICGPRDGQYMDRAHQILGQAASDREDHQTALKHRRISYRSALLSGNLQRTAHAQRHLADTYRRLGRNNEAHSNYDEAISLYRSIAASPADMANALRGLALVQAARGAEDKARSAWTRARQYYEEAGLREGVEEADRKLGELPVD